MNTTKRERKIHERALMITFIAIIIVYFIDLTGEFFNVLWAKNNFFDIAKLVLPMVLLMFHSTYILPLRRSIAFIFLSFMIGFLAEVIGVKYGFPFSSSYSYQTIGIFPFSDLQLFNPKFTFWDVPILVPAYWAIFIYAGYSISTSFLYWMRQDKPQRRQSGLLSLLILISIDIIIVLSIDLILDPILIQLGHWVWASNGNYYGVPITNFLGWSLVVFLSSGVFRIYEYISPKKSEELKPHIFLMPIGSYAIFFALAICVCIRYTFCSFSLIATAIVCLIIITNFGCYVAGRRYPAMTSL